LPTRPLKTGAVRSIDGSLPTVECGARLRALKISIANAQTLPYGSTPLSFALVISTLQGSFDREVNQSILILIGRLLNC